MATIGTSRTGTHVVLQGALAVVVKRLIIGVAHNSTWLASWSAVLLIGATSSASGVTVTHVTSVPELKLLITGHPITSQIGITNANGISCPALSLSRRSLPFRTSELGVIPVTVRFPSLRR